MTEIFFTHADIKANFDQSDVSRGEDYWRRGAVHDLSVDGTGRWLTAQVRGTRAKPYAVTVEVDYSLAKTVLSGECSCPVGIDCKHAAAVCFAVLDVMQKTDRRNQSGAHKNVFPEALTSMVKNPSAPSPTPDLSDIWLDTLTNYPAAADVRGSFESRVIFYMIDIPNDRRLYIPHQVRIRPMIASLLKDGSLGQPSKASIYQIVDSVAHYATPDDRLIGQLLRGTATYSEDFRSPPMDDNFFELVMRRMIATGRCFLGSAKGRPLVAGDERRAQLGWRVQDDGSQLPAIVVNEDTARWFILPAARPWYVDITTHEAGPLLFDVPLNMVHKFLEGPKLLPQAASHMAEKIAARPLSVGILPPRALTVENRPATPPVPCLRLMTFPLDIKSGVHNDGVERVQSVALLHFDYDGEVIDADASDLLQKRIGDRLIRQPRDTEAEALFIRYLTDDAGMGSVLARPSGVTKSRLAYGFNLAGAARVKWLDFLYHEVPELRAKGWRIDVDKDFAERFKAIELDDEAKEWDADLKEQEGGTWWFSLDLGIMVEGQRVALLPLLIKALNRLNQPTTAAIDGLASSGKLYVDMEDGRALALPFERVKGILTTLVELYDQPLNADGSLTVTLDLAVALSRIEAATRMRWLGGKRLKNLIERLKTFNGLVDIMPPRGLHATLRPYQREGLNWLQFLRDYGLGGILADDMGLGKTVQALAHILVEKAARRLDHPCLIICPTSLIPNWQDEAAKFAPKLKVLSLHGKDRAARFDDIQKADIVLTTYPLLPRDCEVLGPIEWHMVVLDEAQAIKNPTTKVTQLVCDLKARHRLCLTGTPIENHLGEAWSLFAFLMPGMLGSYKDFNKRFRGPIEKQKDSDRQAVLAQRLKPFILRRNKSEVAKELPPKTEIIHHVEFDSAQRDLYETLRLTMHDKVQQAVLQKGFSRSHIVILDALLKLRQVCCDPRLVKLPSAKRAKQSAKLDSLMEMLPDMIEEGRRILLFSQFTSMLDLIKPELDRIGIPFVEIRGDTTDRKTPVTRFQSGEVPLFLISLKAGGTGLNLTAADTVIHYDPWWNPAVENQATDRAHRIGQDKPVFVYKFIVKGTVEERILDLQNRKRALASALMDERAEAAAAFEVNDLEFLFKEVG